MSKAFEFNHTAARQCLGDSEGGCKSLQHQKFRVVTMAVANAAIAFCIATAPPAVFQLLLALGAPWGALTMGGFHPGQLPPVLRLNAVFSALILGGAALVVCVRAGLIPGRQDAVRRSVWVVVACALADGRTRTLRTCAFCQITSQRFDHLVYSWSSLRGGSISAYAHSELLGACLVVAMCLHNASGKQLCCDANDGASCGRRALCRFAVTVGSDVDSQRSYSRTVYTLQPATLQASVKEVAPGLLFQPPTEELPAQVHCVLRDLKHIPKRAVC